MREQMRTEIRKEIRKETKMGLLCYAIFSALNFIQIETGSQNPLLHFCLGGFTGLMLALFIVGLLPKNHK